MIKDYYKILGVAPGANADEIRKAYFKKALEYHPDHNPQNPYAAMEFEAINKAYETLKTPHLLEEYLQYRWYAKAGNLQMDDNLIITPEYLITELKLLHKDVINIDSFRMNELALVDKLQQVLCDTNIDILLKANNSKYNEAVLQSIFKIGSYLNFKNFSLLTAPLKKISSTNEYNKSVYDNYYSNKKQQHLWSQYQLVWILVITIFLCLLIKMLIPNN